MVFPWLVVGASAALEASRRAQPNQSERQVRKLRDVEHSLKERQKKLAGELHEAVSVLANEREAHEADKARLSDMDRIQQEIENRMVQLQAMTDELVKENEQLKVERSILQEEARHAQKENQELRNETKLLRLQNSDLEDKMDRIQRESQEEIERVTQLMEDLKTAVGDALGAFKGGGSVAALQERMEELGIKLDCQLEDLQKISESNEGREALEDVVTSQFQSQIGLVMEDRTKLEHLMGIAQNLRLKSSSSTDATVRTADKPMSILSPRSNKIPEGKPVATRLGAGLLSSLAYSSESGNDAGISKTSSSIPSANLPMMDQEGLEKKLEDLTMEPAQQSVELPVTTGPEKVKKAQKSVFNFRFKGISENKHGQQGMPTAKALSRGEDCGDFGSSHLVLK